MAFCRRFRSHTISATVDEARKSVEDRNLVSCPALAPLSSFRGWTQSATAPMPSRLDFGWRSRGLQKSGSLARTCGYGERPRNPHAAGGEKLIAAVKS
jgi:hypothetical protein